MEFINITGPVATQNTGLHCSLLYDCIVLPFALLYFTVMFFLFSVNFVVFSFRATILLNLNLSTHVINCTVARLQAHIDIY